MNETRPRQTRNAKAGGHNFTASFLIGLLLVPLSAVAAVAVVGTGTTTTTATTATDTAALPERTTLPPATTSTIALPTTATVPEAVATVGPDDLAVACGAEGLALVEKEAAGVITPLEQAALDALRAICEAAGSALPGPPAPPPVVRTVRRTVSAAPATVAPAPSAPTAAAPRRGREHEDEREDEREDD